MVLCDKLLTAGIKAFKHEPAFRSRWPNSYEGFGKSTVFLIVRSLLRVSIFTSDEPVFYNALGTQHFRYFLCALRLLIEIFVIVK
jgi:hypothetical protein